ncbi:MAG: hypothetical protein AAFW83_14560 [Pseudomonadota bacterium]
MSISKPLTQDDKLSAFLSVVGGSRPIWTELAQSGASDDRLAIELERHIGIEGGSSPRSNCPATHYKAAGLRIWASWDLTYPLRERPIFAGRLTVSMAREVFAIPDPSDDQLKLF